MTLGCKAWAGVAGAGLLLALGACGGLTEEERMTATGGSRVAEAGAAERAAAVSAQADVRRSEEAERAEQQRLARVRAEEERRQEAIRLAAERRTPHDFQDEILTFVERDEDGLRLIGGGETQRDMRLREDRERRARAEAERAERYDRRYQREARSRERQGEREDRWRDRDESSDRDRGPRYDRERWAERGERGRGLDRTDDYGVEIHRR